MSDEEHGIIRAPNGKFLPGTKGAPRFTSKTAGEAAHKRHEAAERHSREALLKRHNEGGVSEAHTAAEAWGELVGAIGVGAEANAIERPHDAARAAAFVGRATGLLRPLETGSNNMPATGAVLQLSEAATEYIASVLARLAAGAAD